MTSNDSKFPIINDVEIAFGKIPDMKVWEGRAKDAGFEFLDNNIFSKYAMQLFYNGGNIPKKKEGVSDTDYENGIRLFKCWLSSWDPKHERKEEVTGYILSLISDEKWIKKNLK